MAEEKKKMLRVVNTRSAIENLKSFVQAIFQVDEDLAVDLVAVGKTAENFVDLVPHIDVLLWLCEYMIDHAIKTRGPDCADKEFLALKAAHAALEKARLPRLCTCGKCSQKPEAERMPEGAITH